MPVKQITMLSELILNPEQLQALGCLAIETTNLEVAIEFVIKDICKFDQETIDIFIGDQMTIGPKARIMGKLIRRNIIAETKLDKTFKKLFDDISDAIANRNVVIHGSWKGQGAIQSLMKSSATVESTVHKKGSQKSIKASEIKSIAWKLNDLQSSLLVWYLQHKSTLQGKLA